jgi:hypothetical protein
MLDRHTTNQLFHKVELLHTNLKLLEVYLLISKKSRKIGGKFLEARNPGETSHARIFDTYTGFCARMNALANFPSTSARSFFESELIESLAPPSATS